MATATKPARTSEMRVTVLDAAQVKQCGGEDRRIKRTKKALREALIELIEERGLDAFTVNDLCQRADINRGTFYNHYQSKDELLKSFEDEVLDALVAMQAEITSISIPSVLAHKATKKPLPFLVSVFDYLRQEGDFLHAVLGPGGDASFTPRLRDAVCTSLVQSILHEQYRNNPTPFVGYYISYYASGYLGVITRWIETGMKESSDEMALIAMRLLFIRPGESIKL